MKAESVLSTLLKTKKNFIFLGEAGCGKTETALNFAKAIHRMTEREVHFFDLDQTKPLFRSRDVRERLEGEGIFFHYQEQFQDAPTATAGVHEKLADPEAVTVLDVGGNDIGSRLIGGYSGWLSRENTQVFFMINSYRPWSRAIEAIDQTMTLIYRSAGIDLHNTSVILNPNVGVTTTLQEVLEGVRKSEEMLNGILPVSMIAVKEDIAEAAEAETNIPVFPLSLFMTYEWEDEI